MLRIIPNLYTVIYVQKQRGIEPSKTPSQHQVIKLNPAASSYDSRKNNHDTPIDSPANQALPSKTTLSNDTCLHECEYDSTCNQTHNGKTPNEAWDDSECQYRHENSDSYSNNQALELQSRLVFGGDDKISSQRRHRDLRIRARERLRIRFVGHWS